MRGVRKDGEWVIAGFQSRALPINSQRPVRFGIDAVAFDAKARGFVGSKALENLPGGHFPGQGGGLCGNIQPSPQEPVGMAGRAVAECKFIAIPAPGHCPVLAGGKIRRFIPEIVPSGGLFFGFSGFSFLFVGQQPVAALFVGQQPVATLLIGQQPVAALVVGQQPVAALLIGQQAVAALLIGQQAPVFVATLVAAVVAGAGRALFPGPFPLIGDFAVKVRNPLVHGHAHGSDGQQSR